MTPQPRYQPGNRIGGRYLVHKALMGGMGEVYLCLDLEQNYPFALKTFQQRYLTDTQRLRKAFEQEVATWVALEKHPNIVRCFSMRTFNNQPFMLLEWIAGEGGRGTDLRSWLRRGPLDLKLALQIAIDICNGLLHAQAKHPGLVHRDLKPENILMAQGSLAKITDFGLAEIVQTARLEVDGTDPEDLGRQSMMGGKGIAGTPTYMAPEQWRGESLDARTDIYALGCILHELLTGTCPFTIDLVPTIPPQMRRWLDTMQQAHETIPPPNLSGTFTVTLRELIARCLAKAPMDRPVDLHDLITQLITIYQQQFDQPPSRRPTPAEFTTTDYNNRGLTYADLGQHAAALADYTHAIELDPNNATAYYNRGITHADLGQHTAALADYTRAIELDPNNATAHYNRGNTYRDLQEYAAALADYTQALVLNPNDASTYNNRGKTYGDLDQGQAALADYIQALGIDPKHANAYANRGIIYHELGQHQAALADYTQALALNPNDATTYNNRGNTYHELGQHQAALADYTQALALDPIYVTAYVNRGSLHHVLQEYVAALADYTQAITIDSTLATAYSNRGVTYADLGQHTAALADYTQAINLNPNDGQTYVNRGNTYANIQDYASALADYNQAITFNPTFATAYYHRGITYADMQDYTSALADYTQAITFNPNDAKAYANRGVTYAALREYVAALADFTHAIHLDPNDAQAYLNIGALLANQGRLQEALLYFEQAAQLGHPQGAQYAAQVRQMLDIEPEPPNDPAQAAFAAFQQADSLEAIQQAVLDFPLLTQPDFIVAIEQAITQQVSLADRPALTQRLTWLRQIANTPRSTP